MENKEYNNFKVNIDYGDDQFEDIISDTSKNQDKFVDIYSASTTKSPKHYAKHKRKTKKGLKIALIACLCFLLTLCVAFGVVITVFDYNYNDITDEPVDLGFEEIKDKKIVNVALFGLDTRNTNSFSGNSDSIMILSLNTETKKVKIISIMRDSFVPIVKDGKTTYSKINSAYASGGPELAIRTLNQAFGLDISEYATVNFYGMVDIIDAVGGIDAELTRAEVSTADYLLNDNIDKICETMGINPKTYHITTPGKHHLNGIQAVAYSRIRYAANIWGTNNDYGRTDRQRHVMEQLFNKAVTIEKSQYMKLAKSLIPCSETSLSYSEIINLAFSILLHSPSFEQARIPQNEYLMPQPNTSAGSVVYYDLEFAENLIQSFIYDDIKFEDYVAENGIQKNDWYSKLR